MVQQERHKFQITGFVTVPDLLLPSHLARLKLEACMAQPMACSRQREHFVLTSDGRVLGPAQGLWAAEQLSMKSGLTEI
jgi:hypothetical protein